MRNPSRQQIEQTEKVERRRGDKKSPLFCGDDRAEQQRHKQPITLCSTRHFTGEKPTLPFSIDDMSLGIPRFYAVMYAVFVSLEKIYSSETVTRWADYLAGFLEQRMFPANKRRKLQEVLSNTWALSRNYIEYGPPQTRFTPTYNDSLKKFRRQFVSLKQEWTD